MKFIFSLLLAASLTLPLVAQTPTVPPQAQAVGFNNLVFDDEFTSTTYTTSMGSNRISGVNWYPFEWGWSAGTSTVSLNTGAGTGTLAGATGILTIAGGGNLTSVVTYPTTGSTLPISLPGSYHHAYFEARLQFSGTNPNKGGWPAFWSFGTSAFQNVTGSAWTSGYTAECDFFEAYPYQSVFDGCNTLHNWQHSSSGVAGTDLYNTNSENTMSSLQGSTESAQPTDSAWHTYGCLWVGTSATTGYVQFYLDNHLVIHPGGVTQFATGAGTGLPQQELDNLFMILGSGTGWPLNVDWVHVWQTGGSSPAGTTAQTVTGFPSTLSLTTAQSPYALPTSTSAGLPLTYTVASGPATVSNNVLTLTGAGTVVVTATQAGNSTYAPYSGTETIAVTTPGTQSISGFPSTLSLSMGQSPYTLPSTTSAGLTVTYSVASGPATISGNTLTLTGAGIVLLNASQAGNVDYDPYSGSETITVSQVAQNVASFPANLTLTMAQTPYTLPATTSAGLTLSYSVNSGPATVSGHTLTLSGPGTVVLKASQDGNSIYAAYAGTQTITVTALPTQTVTGFPSTLSLLTTQSPYALPQTTAQGLGLTYSVVSGPATVSNNILTLTGPGTVVLTANQAGTGVYAPYNGEEAITVTAATQTLTGFPLTLSLTMGQSPYTLPATTSAGLSITYSVTTGSATVSGDTLTLNAPGTVVVKASQAGNATYAPLTASETIAVAPLTAQTVSTLSSIPQTVTMGSVPVSLPQDTSAGLPLTYTVVSGPATISGNQLSFTGAGTVVVSATQAGSATYSSYSTTLTFTVNAAATLTFAQWEQQPGFFTSAQVANSATSGPTATPENDGVPNLLKYLYDINPATPMTTSEYAAMPVTDVDTTTTPGTTYLTLTYRQYAKVTGLTIQVQVSSDLQNWSTVTPTISHQIGTDSTTGDPIIEDEVATNGSTSEFIRLNVTSP